MPSQCALISRCNVDEGSKEERKKCILLWSSWVSAICYWCLVSLVSVGLSASLLFLLLIILLHLLLGNLLKFYIRSRGGDMDKHNITSAIWQGIAWICGCSVQLFFSFESTIKPWYLVHCTAVESLSSLIGIFIQVRVHFATQYFSISRGYIVSTLCTLLKS